MTKFKKGQSGNPAGKPRGTTSKTEGALKKTYLKLLTKNLPQLQKEIDAMQPKDKVAFFLHCSEFVLPKLARAKVTKEERKTLSGLRDWVITSITPPPHAD